MPSLLVHHSHASSPPATPDFHIHRDLDADDQARPRTDGSAGRTLNAGPPPARTLTPTSLPRINSMKAARGAASSSSSSSTLTTTPNDAKLLAADRSNPTMIQTLRNVPSFEGSDTSDERLSIGTKNSTFSSSVRSSGSAMSMSSTHHTSDERMAPTVRLKYDGQDVASASRASWNSHDANSNGAASLLSDGLGLISHNGSSPADSEDRTNGLAVGGSAAVGDAQAVGSQAWDSSVGKAGLGKTGRVINKLVSDNESLKRDIKIERLKAEEARQAAKLLEDKMDRMVADYESRLLEANVTKTLLARKERQVESLTATVDLERQRASDARDKERSWREEMERTRNEATAKVEEATTHANLMEGRYNAISSHWRDQGDEVKRVVTKMRGEITHLAEERSRDDEKIQTLRELCDQQDGNIRELRRQKEEMARAFEAYKAQQESMLADIKTGAAARQAEEERLLEETREALAKLRWALNVKENVKGAQ